MICATELLPHQQPAVEKLVGLRVGALFMDMGLGKSRTAIELVRRRVDRISRVIWFCPVSLMDTVEYELNKHVSPGEHASVHVFDERTRSGAIPPAFWYVVGIQSISASKRVVLAVKELIDDRTCVVLDESSYIKGHKSGRTWWVTELAKVARYRLILNGTPVSQGVVDLYAQYRFLSPQILGYRSFYSFAANHLEYSERFPGMVVRALNTDVLAHKVAPYTYQVRKEDCLELPLKLYETRYFHMTTEQQDRYQQAKHELLDRLDPDEFDSIAIFRLFTALQQIACGFWSRRELPTHRREKHPLERLTFPQLRTQCLLDVLAHVPDGERVIIWAKFDFDIQAIQSALTKVYGADSVSLFYGLNAATRNDDLSRWRAGQARFLVATPGTGGHGLTLNEAAWVVFYSNGFKYSERAQAEDRCHRIGQSRPVTYIDLVCRGSIDVRIQSALASKADVVKTFRREVEKVKNERRKALLQEL